MENKQSTGCCPIFDPSPWQEKEFHWEGKKFIAARVFTVCYMPIGFGSAVTALHEKARKAFAQTPDQLCLAEHSSPFSTKLLLAVDREVPGAANAALSGTFVTKAYEGDYSNADRWAEDLRTWAWDNGKAVERCYFWYTTCPKCAKAYGKNWTVVFGKLK